MSKISKHLKEPVTSENIELLLESNIKLNNLDKKYITSLIDEPKNIEIELQSFTDTVINIIKENKQVEFQFDKNLYELTAFIIDYCDDNEYTIENHYITNNTTQHLLIEKE